MVLRVIFFKFQFPNGALLVYRNTIDVCVLTIGAVKFLNSLISSRKFCIFKNYLWR